MVWLGSSASNHDVFSWAGKPSDLCLFHLVFISLYSSNLRQLFGKPYNFEDILKFL